jgi:hypothetical protein
VKSQPEDVSAVEGMKTIDTTAESLPSAPDLPENLK